jgi:hypothetical protein
MRWRLLRVWLSAFLGCSAILGCELTADHNKYPHDPLLLSKKPVEGKLGDAKPLQLARAEPIAPPLPNTALVSLPPSRETPSPLNVETARRPEETKPQAADPIPRAVQAVPAVRSGISSVVPGSPAVRRRISGLYGYAPDYSWLQGMLQSEDGRIYLRYCERGLDDPWGGKVALEDDPRLGAFQPDERLMMEGEMVTDNDQQLYDKYRYPRYRVRNVWRVPE